MLGIVVYPFRVEAYAPLLVAELADVGTVSVRRENLPHAELVPRACEGFGYGDRVHVRVAGNEVIRAVTAYQRGHGFGHVCEGVGVDALRVCGCDGGHEMSFACGGIPV